ncbi:MAG: hypothetical protein J6T10_00930 [Methanobrevibacter sp.]|nr:hypothetical protein [Methanobrevibacter sp.]
MVEAKYTKLFRDWLISNPELSPLTDYGEILLAYMSSSSFTSDMSSDMVNMLSSVYRYYECGSNDNEEMLQFLKDTFDEYKDYYYELIINYKKEYDYALNNKRVVTKKDELNMLGNTNVVNDDKNKQTEYQLPNKVVDENYRSTPSTIVDNDSKTENNKDYSNNTTRDSSTTTEFNNEFIDLKNKYMNQIRNVYREFAMKFKDCFYQVY